MKQITISVREMVELSHWWNELKIDNLIKEINAISEIFRKNQTGPKQESFDKQRTTLITHLKKIDAKRTLTMNQFDILQKFEVLLHLGNEGADNIQHILREYGNDCAATINRLEPIKNKIEDISTRFSQIRLAFKDLPITNFSPPNNILEITYHGNVAITQLTEHKKQADELWKMIRGLVLPFNIAPESIELDSIVEGSIKVRLLIPCIFALHFLSKTTGYAYEIVADFVGAVEIIEQSKHNRVLRALELDRLYNEKYKEAHKTVLKEFNETINEEIPDIDPEMKINVMSSANALFQFIYDGGDIDIILQLESTEEPKEVEKIEEIKKIREKTRRISSERKLIEYQSKDND